MFTLLHNIEALSKQSDRPMKTEKCFGLAMELPGELRQNALPGELRQNALPGELRQ